MKVLSVVTGIGYGHTTRQAAILEELEKQGAEIIIASYSNGLDFFEHRYPLLEIEGPKLSEKNFEFLLFHTIFMNLKLPLTYLKNYFKLRRLIKAFKPDIIISDFEPLPLYMSTSIPHFLVFNFDPLLYQNYLKEGLKRYSSQYFYISWIYKRAQRIQAPIILPVFEKSTSEDYIYVNPIVRDLPDQTQRELLEKLKLSKSPIIIMFGGSHFATDLLYKIQEVLSNLDENFIIFTYKISGESRNNIAFLPFKENFLEYLKASKAIITQAGYSTLSEILVLKKPSLLFPIPNYLEHAVNAHWMEKHKFSLIEDSKYLTEESLLKILKKFIAEIPSLQENLKAFDLEPTGAKEAADFIIKKSRLK